MKKNLEYINASFGVREVAFLTKNVHSKNQLTLQMTWQEGKSEDFREILRCGKRNKMPYVGYEGVENLQISLKIDTKKTLSKSVLV